MGSEMCIRDRNKAIFQVWRYRYPASLVTGQTLFTVLAIFLLSNLGVIKIATFNRTHFKRVFTVSAVFQLKLVLDMSALVLVNIPMYGILKSATTPFVMLLDYLLRQRVPSARIQGAVWLTTAGGLVAGYGDLYFDPLGYALALASARSRAGRSTGRRSQPPRAGSWLATATCTSTRSATRWRSRRRRAPRATSCWWAKSATTYNSTRSRFCCTTRCGARR